MGYSFVNLTNWSYYSSGKHDTRFSWLGQSIKLGVVLFFFYQILHLSSDIHKVADEIARINSSNVNKIRVSLVEKWLPSSLQNKQDEADMVSETLLSCDSCAFSYVTKNFHVIICLNHINTPVQHVQAT